MPTNQGARPASTDFSGGFFRSTSSDLDGQLRSLAIFVRDRSSRKLAVTRWRRGLHLRRLGWLDVIAERDLHLLSQRFDHSGQTLRLGGADREAV